MDFPKEHTAKKRANTGSLHQTSKQHQHPFSFGSTQTNKGKVRIEQYQYQEENLLGQGYTSKVYLGRLVEKDRKQFAIKVVDKRKLSKSRQNLQLLKQQMVIHKQLQHPNIVKCYDILEKKDHYYFILEYCPHGTLDSFIKNHQKLSESVAISTMQQILAGYKYLLSMKVLHRDLKPPNILKSGPNWKICDFGFSVIGKKNLVGEINVGTPAYMAPESLERTFYSPKTDLFSLGVLCYEMLFGIPPWQHKNEKILLQKMKQVKLDEQLFTGFRNQNLVIFITKCCEPNERKRMKPQEFENFDFWKETEKPQQVIEVRSSEQVRPPCKSFKINLDYSSTCNSQTSIQHSAIRSAVKSNKNISIEQLFKGNSTVIERELYHAVLIYYLAKNNSYLLLQEATQKELYLTILAKHLNYIVRRIKHQKVNYLGLKKWTEYRVTEQYLKLKTEADQLDLKMKQLITSEIKKKTIITIRTVNKKFDDLTYDQNLSANCIANLKEYTLDLMEDTAKNYQVVGMDYITDNSWTTQTLEYLMEYFRYIGQISKSTEESRISALQEEGKEREWLLEHFGCSRLGLPQFQSLKEQLQALRN